MAVRSLWMAFLMVYSIMKKITTYAITSSDEISKIISVALTISVMLSTSLCMIPFLIFRSCLYIALKLNYGKDFGGFLTGNDAIFEAGPEATVVTMVAIHRLPEDDKAKHVELMKKFVRALFESTYKYGSCLGKSYGYCYFIRNRVKVEDIMEFVVNNETNYISRNTLLDYIQQNCWTMKDDKMAKVVVFLQPIKWNEGGQNEHGKQYAILIHTRHSMADGPSLMASIRNILVRAKEGTGSRKMNLRFNTGHTSELTLDDVYFHRNPIVDKLEGDIFKIEGNSEWYVAISSETEQKYMGIIRAIKNKLEVSFIDVVNAAISSSLLDYIDERKITTDSITAVTVIPMQTKNLEEIIKGTYNFSTVSNDTSVLVDKLPFKADERSMKSKILTLNETRKYLLKATDYNFAYSFLRYIGTYIPIYFLELISKIFVQGVTLSTTNMVGCEKSSIVGCDIKEAFYCVPNPLNVGFMFCIFTYDKRLTITVTSLKGIVHNRKELQAITDNVFGYIDQAKAEIL